MSAPETICENPDGLLPCRWCGVVCAETSEAIVPARGADMRAIRITATCEAAFDYWLENDEDSIRTKLLLPDAAVLEWNKMQERPL